MNDVGRRLRDVERQRLRLPPGADPLQTFENGSPLGDTRFLDFGEGIQATLIGDDFVRITGAGGGTGTTWDAILDASIPATDTTAFPPVFKNNVKEVLDYLEGLGYTRAYVFVRPGTYTETASFSPATMSLLVLFSPVDHTDAVQWLHAGFNMGNLSYHCYGMLIQAGAKTSMFQGSVAAWRCRLNSTGMQSPFRLTTGQSYIYDCIIYNGPMQLGSTATMIGGQIEANSRSVTLATTWLEMVGVVIGVGGTSTWTMPNRTFMSFSVETALDAGTFDSGFLTLSGASAAGVYFIENNTLTTTRVSVSISSTPASVSIVGRYQDITTPAQQNPFTQGSVPTRIDASVEDDLDVTGPAVINIRQNGNQTALCQLRGRGIVGAISRWDNGSSLSMVEFINADQCDIVVAGDGTSATGTRSPYSFDASSANNVLVFAGRTTFPAAGTDAGTNNRVLPEGASPPPGAPSGGHVIEDEGTPLTQRANLNFIGAGVTATDSSPDTLVTIPGVGTPTAGWGSITNVTVDRAYDANATSLDEIADVLGQLVADLIAQGVIAT